MCTMTGTSEVCCSVGSNFVPCCVFDQSIEEIINQSPLLSENQRLLSCVWYGYKGFRSRKSVPEDSVGSTVEKQRDFTVVV